MIRSQDAFSSAVSKLCRVSTRKWSTVKPARSRFYTIRAVSSSESSTNSSRNVPREGALDIEKSPREARTEAVNGGANPTSGFPAIRGGFRRLLGLASYCVQVSVTAQIKFTINQRRRGIEAVVQCVLGQNLERRALPQYDRRAVAPGDIHATGRADG